MAAWFVRLALLAPAAALLAFGIFAGDAWYGRHVLLPALNPPPPFWVFPALRLVSLGLSVALGVCGALAARRATLGGVARSVLAAALSVCASEGVLRLLYRGLPVPRTRLEARLAIPDPRTGWSFVPRRRVDLPMPGDRLIRYETDAYGDRAISAEWTEDPRAPSILIAGESVAMGHGLPWPQTFAAGLGDLMQLQVVDVAEGGYGNDQAYLRAAAALARLSRPFAVVTTVLPVQLHRNLRDDRPHLVLRNGSLVWVPASAAWLKLRQLFVNDLPYLSDADLAESLALGRAILRTTAALARAKGAQPLFVFVSTGRSRPVDAHAEAFIIHSLLDGLPSIVFDLEPEHCLPGDFGHPDAEGARQLAGAIAEALARTPVEGSTAG
jgi:hypothetical protein